MNLFYQPLIGEGIHHLDEEESRHCVKVLRRNPGDVIRLTDGRGFFYDAAISKADSRKCEFIIQKTDQVLPRDFRIHIAISPTKNTDRIEWFVEKAVEFGVEEISLIECDHSERTFIKSERLKKIAVSAMKQSLKANLPQINELQDFQIFVSQMKADEKFIAYVDSTNPLNLQSASKPGKSSVVLIGPEGDFSKEEIETSFQNGFIKVSLGKSRLRTETAGLAACHILNLVNA